MIILIGVLLLILAISLVIIPVFTSMTLTNFGIALFFMLAFAGLFFTVIGIKLPNRKIG